MNLLVTGGAGFIGSHFIRRALKSDVVRVLVNVDALTYAGSLENLRDVEGDPRYRFVQGNVCDGRILESVFNEHQINHVVHLAAESHVDRSIQNSAPFIETNVVGTHRILEAARGAWTSGFAERRFVYVSTDEVYGSLSEGAAREDSVLAPNSPYAASKASAELMARAFLRTHGLPVIVTRCSNNFGPGQYPEKLIPVVIRSLAQRRPIPVYGTGANVRDWLYVKDHARALWKVLTEGRVGEIYNIAGAAEWTNLQLVERLCDLVDEIAPELGGDSRKLIQFVGDRPGHDFRYALNDAKIRRDLGWAPVTSFDGALRETVAHFLRRFQEEGDRLEGDHFSPEAKSV